MFHIQLNYTSRFKKAFNSSTGEKKCFKSRFCFFKFSEGAGNHRLSLLVVHVWNQRQGLAGQGTHPVLFCWAENSWLGHTLRMLSPSQQWVCSFNKRTSSREFMTWKAQCRKDKEFFQFFYVVLALQAKLWWWFVWLRVFLVWWVWPSLWLTWNGLGDDCSARLKNKSFQSSVLCCVLNAQVQAKQPHKTWCDHWVLE